MAEESKPRVIREAQVRDNTTREDELRQGTRKIVQWRPASALPEIPEVPGWRFRFVRKSIYGAADPTNMSKKRREYWVPVALSEMPGLEDFVDPDARNSGLVEIGGLILHKMPEEMARAREAFYRNRSNTEIAAAEAQYREQARPVSSMEIFSQNKSEVKFGSGNS